MYTLSTIEIEEFASRRGARREDVEDFLSAVGHAGKKESELLNLYYDARNYDWNISTIRAIEEGIKSAYERGSAE